MQFNRKRIIYFWIIPISLLFFMIFSTSVSLAVVYDDMDQVDADIENQVPGAKGQMGDGNGDEIPDAEQPNVTSFKDISGEHFLTLENTQHAQQWAVKAVYPPEDAPPDVKFPYGMLEFKVQLQPDMSHVVMRLYLPKDTSINGYWKKNIRTNQWENIATNIEHGPTYAPNKTVITFELWDGGDYDEDGAQDGSITDQGGPGIIVPPVGTASVPTLNQIGIIALFISLIFAAVILNRKKASLVS